MDTKSSREYTANKAYWIAKEHHQRIIIENIDKAAQDGKMSIEFKRLGDEHAEYLTSKGFKIIQRGDTYAVSWDISKTS